MGSEETIAFDVVPRCQLLVRRTHGERLLLPGLVALRLGGGQVVVLGAHGGRVQMVNRQQKLRLVQKSGRWEGRRWLRNKARGEAVERQGGGGSPWSRS